MIPDSLRKYVYYEEPGIVLLHGDCLDMLPHFEPNSIDLVLTDPPYGVGFKYKSYKDTIEAWKAMFCDLIPLCIRTSSMTIMPSCQIKLLSFIYNNHPPDWLIAWYKGSVGHNAFIGFNDWEPHLVYGKTDKLCMHDYFSATPEAFNNGHPCPKPIKWATWLIERASKDSHTILDPFLGSGTTAVACKQLGRKCIGIELESKYLDIAIERLRQEVLF